jgi:DNA-binding transcriptional LysR family regulator
MGVSLSTVNRAHMAYDAGGAAMAGLGLAYLPKDQVLTHIAAGRLIWVLGDWCPPFSGYHLYYPSHRHLTPAFAVVVEALRYRRARSGTRKAKPVVKPM